jgi:phage-related protein
VLRVVKACVKELSSLSAEVRFDLADAIERLEAGQRLSMPLSRPMPSVAQGVHELRLRDRAGIYRVFYALVVGRDIWLLHAHAKKTQAATPHTIELVRKRLKEIMP